MALPTGVGTNMDLIRKFKCQCPLESYANANNATATATLAPLSANWRVRLLGVVAGFSTTTAMTALLTVSDSVGTLFVLPVNNQWPMMFQFEAEFGRPDAAMGGSMTAVLGASGTGGTYGYVYMFGFQVNET
jgi:hypothetical protein